jgi:hypothetical protein
MAKRAMTVKIFWEYILSTCNDLGDLKKRSNLDIVNDVFDAEFS